MQVHAFGPELKNRHRIAKNAPHAPKRCSAESMGLTACTKQYHCVNKLLGVTAAGLEYAINVTEATCTAYKDSLQTAIDGGCDDDDGGLAATLADLPDDCSDADDSGGGDGAGSVSLYR